MSNDLIPTEQKVSAISYMARNAHASKFYSALGGEAGIFSIMMLAQELGIPPMQAISGGIHCIQGKVEISARMMNMKIRQGGHTLKITHGEDFCEIYGCRKDTGEDLTIKYSMKDAERAGLLNKDNWKKNPRAQRFARCISTLAVELFPDVIGTCYVEDEIPRQNIAGQKSDDDDILPFIEESKEKAPKKSSAKKIAPINEVPIEYAAVENMEDLSDQNTYFITPAQCAHILELIKGDPSRLSGLLGHYKVGAISDLSPDKYQEVVEILSQEPVK